MPEFLAIALLAAVAVGVYFDERRRDERKDDDDRWKMSGGPGGYKIS